MSDLPSRALAAEAAIRRTLARYCHTIDDGDFESLGTCFASEAKVDAFGKNLSGRDAITAFLTKLMPPEVRGKHLTVNTVISGLATRDDSTTASALSDFLFIGPDKSIMTGRYADEFIQVDGAWLISKREIQI